MDYKITGLAGCDSLYTGGGKHSLEAGNYSDLLYSGAGNDTLLGGQGYDSFYLLSSASSYGRDSIDGGPENDSLQFGANATTGAVVDLAAGPVSGGSSNAPDGATIVNVERGDGTRFGDRL